MKKLIIITGCSGSGKTSLASSLHKKLDNSTYLSLDMLLEKIYDLVGFKNIQEKKSLRSMVRRMYKSLLRETLKRGDEIVIVEHPFKKEWIPLFQNLQKEFDYELFTINIFIKDYETHWKNLVKREKENRHQSHYLQSYNIKNKDSYEPYLEFDYDSHKKEYESRKVYNINLGKVINIEDISLVNLYDIIEEITEN